MDTPGPDISPTFLGLSYESARLLPGNGHYYFDANDRTLVDTFKTLGIKSLRVGANGVDDPKIPVPQEKDIDSLFDFARAAGVKVIYSFRLKNGNPAESARLASYIESHDADLLDSFSIGNEPENYKRTSPGYADSYREFYRLWKAQYDAIVKAVPQARIEGPSSNSSAYTLNLVRDVFADGHLSMATSHYYIFDRGKDADKNPAALQARYLSNSTLAAYDQAYAKTAAILAAKGVPFRIDETNSCWDNGDHDSSDTYASTLWALDWTHWWAAHHILGLNFHTGQKTWGHGKISGPKYTSFLRLPDGMEMRPIAYAELAFSQGAHGRPLGVRVSGNPAFDFTAYAYRDHDGSIDLTLINKTFGDEARPASVSLQLPSGMGPGTWQRMDLANENEDVGAKEGITLGGASIDSHGVWPGQWKTIEGAHSGNLTVEVPPASAALLRFQHGN